MINQLKATSKLTILRPELEQIKQEMQDRGMSPSAVAEGQEKMKKVFTENGVSTFTPLKGLFIQGPVFVSFFLAIQNMVEKVPSFQHGGISWFIDLTTADTFYILPFLTAFSLWITVEVFDIDDTSTAFNCSLPRPKWLIKCSDLIDSGGYAKCLELLFTTCYKKAE